MSSTYIKGSTGKFADVSINNELLTQLRTIHNSTHTFVILVGATNLSIPTTGLTVFNNIFTYEYKFKTLSVKCDVEVNMKLYLYDLAALFDANDPYYQATIAANKAHTISWQEDFYYARLDVVPTASAGILTFCYLKGRRF